jgi:DmsE family decaheme c-type cytochrome
MASGMGSVPLPLIVALFGSVALLPATSCAQASAAGEYSPNGADTCLLCHNTPQVVALFETRHGAPADPRSPFGHGQLQCEACHGPGGAHASLQQVDGKMVQVIRFDAESGASVETQNSMCLGCHETESGFAWHGSAHDDRHVSCAGCHRVHTAQDPVMRVSTQADRCFTCHAFRRSDALKPYGHPLREGKMACTGCHDPHSATAEKLLVRQTVNETCYQCHAEKRGPFLWEHPPVAEDCTICHDPHGSNQPGMLVSRAPLLCQGCHSQSGHPSLAHDAGGLASGTPSAYLLGQGCLNCHSQIHGSNHPSGSKLMR